MSLFENFQNLFVVNNRQGNQYDPLMIDKNWSAYEKIAATNPVIARAINKWHLLVDSDIHVSVNQYNNDNRNERVRRDIKTILARDIEPLITETIKVLAIKGNVFWMFNSDGELVVQHPDFFELKYDYLNNVPLGYDLIYQGRTITKNLQHGVDIYHFKNPFSNHEPVAYSPIDQAADNIYTFLHATQYHNDEFSSGLSGNLFGRTKDSMDDKISQKDSEGYTYIERTIQTFKNFFKRSKKDKSTNLMANPVLDSISSFGKSPADMETSKLISEQVGFMLMPFNLSPQSIGYGQTTYNNTEILTQKESELTNALQEMLIEAIINWYLLDQGIRTSRNSRLNIDVKFSNAVDKQTSQQQTQAIELIDKAGNVLTTREKRKIIAEAYDMDLDESDNEETEEEQNQQDEETDSEEDSTERVENSIKNYKATFATPESRDTPTDQALDSSIYERTERDPSTGEQVKKGFKPRMQKALRDQIEQVINRLQQKTNIDDVDLDEDFVKLETVLPKQVLQSELLNFSDFVSDGEELTENTVKYIEARTELLLRGYQALTDEKKEQLTEWSDTDYEGLDRESKRQMQTDIAASNSVDEAIDNLQKRKVSAELRGGNVAHTETANAVEGSRFKRFQDKGYQWKRWLDVDDSRVRPGHASNESQVIIPIDKAFSNGNMRAGQEPNCRCSTIYGETKEELQ